MEDNQEEIILSEEQEKEFSEGKGEENGADRYYKRKKKCPERP